MRSFRLSRRAALAGPLALAGAALLPRALRAQTTVPVERVVSPGGIEAWLVSDRRLPLTAIEASFRGGAAQEPAGREGLSRMLTGMLTEGAGALDTTAFAAAVEDRSIALSFGSDPDSLSGSMRVITRHRAEGVRLMRAALTEPRFDADSLERLRTQLVTNSQRLAVTPGVLASRAWYGTAFRGHPYGRTEIGTPESLGAVTRDDLVAFHRARLARSNLVVAAAGDIDARTLASLLDDLFGGLPATAAPADTPPATVQGGGSTIVVRRPFPQSLVQFGHGGILRGDPDFYAATVMNHVLGGGGFGSRLMTEIRERRGLTYGVYSSVAAFDRAGLVIASMSTVNQRAGDALALAREEWRKMHDTGPKDEEIEEAKLNLVGSFPLRFDALRPIARFLVSMQWHGLGIDFIDRRNALIEAVTVADARRVARRLLQPDALLVVVVGSPEGVTATETRG